jgi:hypothetical protein
VRRPSCSPATRLGALRRTSRSCRTVTSWREELYARGVLDRDAKSPREDFRRVRNQPQTRNLIGVHSDFVWKLKAPSTTPPSRVALRRTL